MMGGREEAGRGRGEGREREVEVWQFRIYKQNLMFECLSEFNGPQITRKVYSTI